MNHILRSKYLPTFAFWPYPCPLYQNPKSVMIKTPSSLTCLFIKNIYLYINIIIKYQLITLFSGISKNIRQGVLSWDRTKMVSPPTPRSLLRVFVSLFSHFSLCPGPARIVERPEKRKKETNLSKNTFTIG